MLGRYVLWLLVIVGVVALVAGCSEDRRRTPGDGGVSGFDASASSDSGGTDAGVSSDAAASDSGSVEDAGSTTFPTPEYDAEGCLTWASAQAICGFSSDGVACAAIASCEFSTASQCMIDCEMATTLCIQREMVDACLAAIGAGCDAISACNGWMYFAG